MHMIFVDQLPANVSGKYAHYKHQRVGGSRWEYCDVRKYIAQHQDKWLNYVELWHSELSKIGLGYTKWWWLMPESRLIAWHPPHLKPLFFAIALIEYCEKFNYDELYLVECPDEVYSYLKELKPDYCISFCQVAAKQQRFGMPYIRGIYKAAFSRKIINIFLRQLTNLRALMMLVLCCLQKSKNLSAIDKVKLVIYSHALDVETLLQKGDHFFGPMFDEVSGIDRKDILWLYFTESRKERIAVEEHMRSAGHKAVFLYELITLTDFIRIILASIRLAYNMRFVKNESPPLKIDKYQSLIFSKIFFSELLQSVLPITELAVYFAVRRLLKSTGARALIYPYEEKGLERAIVYACRDTAENAKTIGFAHAVYNNGHLYLRRNDRLIKSPKPDFIASTGAAQRDWLIKWALVRPEQIAFVGSPRYHARLPLHENFESRPKCLRVLILTGMGYELGMLANYLEESAGLFSDCEVLIRRYPYAWQAQQDEGIYRLRKLFKNIRVETGSMLGQLSWCDVVIYSSTSAGLEAMLSGRLAIYAELHDFLILDPMAGKGDPSKIIRCSTPGELKTTLQNIRNMNLQDYLMAVQRQHEFASQIYAPVDVESLSQLITHYKPN